MLRLLEQIALRTSYWPCTHRIKRRVKLPLLAGGTGDIPDIAIHTVVDWQVAGHVEAIAQDRPDFVAAVKLVGEAVDVRHLSGERLQEEIDGRDLRA